MALNLSAVVLYIVSLFLRMNNAAFQTSRWTGAMTLEIVALVTLRTSRWLGGLMAYVHRVRLAPLKSLLAASLLFVCGCKVTQPGVVEKEMAKEVKHKITVGGKDDVNPIPATEANIADGREHFGHHCGICHGLDGQATGVPFADKMSPPVPSLSAREVQDYADGQLKWIIDNGINPSGMPAWKGSLSDEEMWKVVVFLRHLPPKGGLGIPDVYKEEQEEHEHMHKGKHHD